MLSPGKEMLSSERIQAILSIPEPITQRQVRAFPGLIKYSRFWIPTYGEKAWHLYETLKESNQKETTSLQCGKDQQRAIKGLKKVLTQNSCFEFAGLWKPLLIKMMGGDYIRGFNTGLGTYQETNWLLLKRTGYSSPGLGHYPVTTLCLRVVTAAALLLELAFKLSLRQEVTLYASHQIGSLLNTKWPHWLTNNCMLQYQVTLIKNLQVKTANCTVLNPTTLVPASNKKLNVLEASGELKGTISLGCLFLLWESPTL